jgi:hypothetical protein
VRVLPPLPLLLVLLAAGCAGPTPDGQFEDLVEPPAPLRLLAIGDAGTGEAGQFQVARAMEAVCAARGCDAVLDLGDLLYPSGASSPDDPQFDAKFERPYANLTVPFWMVLGNHDNSAEPGGTGTWDAQGDNEVAYGARTDRASAKWTMPGRFYHATLHAPAVDADLFALDTNTLLAADLKEQGPWLDGALAGSRALWRLAIGHHPYVSNGPHGDAGAYDGRPVPGLSGEHFRQFFEARLCGKVDLYLAGHDHTLQWLPAQPGCGATEFVVSGAGGAATYDLVGDHAARFQSSSLGFWWLELDAAALRAVAFDADGKALHELSLSRTRSA